MYTWRKKGEEGVGATRTQIDFLLGPSEDISEAGVLDIKRREVDEGVLSAPEVAFSDHRPVAASIFRVKEEEEEEEGNATNQRRINKQPTEERKRSMKGWEPAGEEDWREYGKRTERRLLGIKIGDLGEVDRAMGEEAERTRHTTCSTRAN